MVGNGQLRSQGQSHDIQPDRLALEVKIRPLVGVFDPGNRTHVRKLCGQVFVKLMTRHQPHGERLIFRGFKRIPRDGLKLSRPIVTFHRTEIQFEIRFAQHRRQLRSFILCKGKRTKLQNKSNRRQLINGDASSLHAPTVGDLLDKRPPRAENLRC